MVDLNSVFNLLRVVCLAIKQQLQNTASEFRQCCRWYQGELTRGLVTSSMTLIDEGNPRPCMTLIDEGNPRGGKSRNATTVEAVAWC